MFKATDGLADFPPHLISAADVALNKWGEFLLGTRQHPGRHEQHMFLLGAIELTTAANVPANINRYLLRTVEVYVACTHDSAITYAKMGRFVLFGFIAIPRPRRWKGTRLNARTGVFGVRDIELPSDIGEFIMERARRCGEKYAEISDRQQSNTQGSNA